MGTRVDGNEAPGGVVDRSVIDGGDDSVASEASCCPVVLARDASGLDDVGSVENRTTRSSSSAEQDAAAARTMRRCCVERRYQQLGRLPEAAVGVARFSKLSSKALVASGRAALIALSI